MLKIVGWILFCVFAIIGLFCSYIFVYEARNPHMMGNDSTFLKLYYKYFPKKLEKTMIINGVEPFTPAIFD
jgi:hypothetical protein